ncbi:hypothetical protein [Streptomyces sp. NPDC058240]|uniref:hypothetical protein n=1 Tax=Streptomyces sp. NPDC058240 TaxID=3346396 RepID=UPI0036E2ED96
MSPRLTVLASRGARWAHLRIRIISIVMPLGIVAVDMIPGVCPAWFAVMQAACTLAIAAAAFVINGSALRAVFPTSR